MARELAKHNIITAPRTTNKISRHLDTKQKQPPSDILEKTGVYKIKCEQCDCFYIGQTDRSFKQRLKEHLPAIKTKAQKSSFAQHIVDEGHTFYSN